MLDFRYGMVDKDSSMECDNQRCMAGYNVLYMAGGMNDGALADRLFQGWLYSGK